MSGLAGRLTAGVCRWVLGSERCGLRLFGAALLRLSSPLSRRMDCCSPVVWQRRGFESLARVAGDWPSHPWIHIRSSLMVIWCCRDWSLETTSRDASGINRARSIPVHTSSGLALHNTIKGSNPLPTFFNDLTTLTYTYSISDHISAAESASSPIVGEQTTFPE